jgi:hypothetical protein
MNARQLIQHDLPAPLSHRRSESRDVHGGLYLSTIENYYGPEVVGL